MKIAARLELHGAIQEPDPWDQDWGLNFPLHHIICRDLDGTPHTVGEFIWPWTAYTALKAPCLLHFLYWKQNSNKITVNAAEITDERLRRIRELQFLMTRHIYYGAPNSPKTLTTKLYLLHRLARFAETRSCGVIDVLTRASLIDAFGESLSSQDPVITWTTTFTFFSQLELKKQLGFPLARPTRWKDLERRIMEYRGNRRQFAPLPTRIYAALINNLSAELDDIEAHKPRLLAALRDAATAQPEKGVNIGKALFSKYDLTAYLEKRGFDSCRIRGLSSVLREIFLICKLQIHVFSGMRDEEAIHLPYHCMAPERSPHGRNHCLIAGITTKLNNGRRARTKWVTTELDGFRAIRLAQDFADVVYEILDVVPSESDDFKDDYPLFPSTCYLPWMPSRISGDTHIARTELRLAYFSEESKLLSRLSPTIEEEDIAELESIDPFRAWREESEFAIGQPWPLTTHQLRRSLAVYANASGFVRLSSLRRQLQHITREMSLYYGRGSTFCKNFIEDDLIGYKKHVLIDWQTGGEEAEMLAFVRDVLNSAEPMFGPAGTFYERQRERGEVMSREEVSKQMKAGLLAYREGPLGGCTRPGVCETRKGLNLIDTACATECCKHLIGKHSKIVQTIRLKRASMIHITPGTITEAMELEELESLERIEREWRPSKNPTRAH